MPPRDDLDRPAAPPAATAEPVRTTVRSIGLDRITRTVGALLARDDGSELVFVPLDRHGAAAVAGARRVRSVDPGIALLLGVISGLGARVEHVRVALAPPGGAHGHPAARRAELALTDASRVRCDPAKGLAVAVHAGVPVLLDDVAAGLFVAAHEARARYTAPTSDPVERSVEELLRVLAHARAADFDLPA